MSQETELIKERLDIGEVIGEYVQLKQNGRHLKGLCPFHQEKTPSFVVSPDKGIFHCFGCMAGGDVFAFIQQKEGIDFPAALVLLAQRAGVTLPERSGNFIDPRQRLFSLLELAARFYQEILVNQAAGKKPLSYLATRGLTSTTIATFVLGYAPQQWDTVSTYLRQKGYLDAEIINSGLVGRNQQGRLYDRFRGRIMFPIHDVQGRVIAFGGRIVPWHATGNEGKYINSPETQIYQKRQVVYNLHRAKKIVRKTNPCIVVEGYMDVVMLTQVGHANVVASSGTAFTAEQIVLLQRYTDLLHFAFDADSAGVAAAQSATFAAMAAGMRVATLVFPSGKDPADVAQSDPAALTTYIEQPVPLVTLLLQRLQVTTATDRENVLARLLPLVKNVGNAVQQGEMIVQIAQELHVPESVIVNKLATIVTAPLSAPAPERSPDEASPIAATHVLLGLVILEPATRGQLTPVTVPISSFDPNSQALYQALVDLAKVRLDFRQLSGDQLVAYVPESQRAFAEAVRLVGEEYVAKLDAHRQSPADIEHEVERLWKVITLSALEARLSLLQRELAAADSAQQAKLLADFKAVVEELHQAQLAVATMQR